jgi:integrase
MNTIPEAADEYLVLRRGLGFKLRDAGILLRKFVAFLKRRRVSYITTGLALAWATQPANVQPVHLAYRLSVVRAFARYRSATDPRTEVPPPGLLPHRARRKPPYIYTDTEIGRLINAARKLPSATGLRARTYATLLALLAVSGMRISEAVGLERDDVDLTAGVLTVRRTKFGKSRLVPLHPSSRHALQRYAKDRDRIQARPRTTRFLVGQHGEPLTTRAAQKTFVRLSRQIGLRGSSDRRGPRLHDMRHRFAVDTLLRWYRMGVDVERHLPELSTYLGHTHPTDTYWYLSAVPELMRLAMARLESRTGGSSS